MGWGVMVRGVCFVFVGSFLELRRMDLLYAVLKPESSRVGREKKVGDGDRTYTNQPSHDMTYRPNSRTCKLINLAQPHPYYLFSGKELEERE
jgi:hypothetical protein